MAAPINSRLDKNGHRQYKWTPTKEKFPSVTTILENGSPKPQLPYWSARLVAEAAVSDIDKIAAMVKTTDPKKVIERLKAAPHIYSASRARVGDAVHHAIEDYIRFQRRPLVKNREAEATLDYFEKFMEDWQPKFLYTEATIYNRQYQYAGTADDFVIIKGHKLVLDVKSGKGVWDEAAVQMSAYARGEFIGIGNKELPVPKVDGAAVLHIRQDGYKFLPVYIGDEVFEQFLRIREVYRFLYERDTKIIGSPLTPQKLAKMNGNTPQWIKDVWMS